MSDLVTIMTFDNILDANMAASRLEGAAIKTYIQDQYTIEAKPGSADIYGRIKLQISSNDTAIAIDILKNTGYFNEQEEERSGLAISLDNLTDKVPFLHKYPLQIKLLAIIFFLLAATMVIVVLKNTQQQ